MTVLKSWAVPTGQGTVDGRHSLGALLWPGSGTMGKRAGRFPKATGAFAVTATTPTPDGYVHVSGGAGAFMGTRSIAPYIIAADATEDVNVLAVAADASLARHDLIVAQQSDTTHGDANSDLWIGPVRGTPSATPADPAVGIATGAPTNSPDYVILARVVVGAGVTSITSAAITQLLTATTVAAGGVLPISSLTERDTLTGTRYSGMTIARTDRTSWLEIFDGTAWRVRGPAVCSSTADRDTAITHPHNGLLATTTDTGTVWIYHSGAWVRYPDPPSAMLRQTVVQPLDNNTFEPVSFDAEDWDTHAAHAGGTPTRFTAPLAGKYVLSGGVGFAVNATGSRGCVWLKNGAQINGSQVMGTNNGAILTTLIAAKTIPVQLAVGDYVELAGYQNSGAGLDTTVAGSDQSYMSVEYRRS